jgi:hypothetical protein
MKPKLLYGMVFALAGLVLSGSLGAAPGWQGQLNYQGQLTDSSGNAVADGTYNLTFRLYTVSSGGAAIWTETQSTVSVTKGLFNVILGSVSSLNVLTTGQLNGDLWLTVQVLGDAAEMSPRQQLMPSMFSRNAQYLNGLSANNTANNLPLLDATGHLPASVVPSSGLSVPVFVYGSGAPYSLGVSNTAVTGPAIQAQGAVGVSATASDTSSPGVWGMSSPSDTAAGMGVRASATNGLGLFAESVNNTAISATTGASSTKPAISASGLYAGQFLTSGGVSGIAVQAQGPGGGTIGNLADKADGAGVYGFSSFGSTFGVYGNSPNYTGIYGKTTSPSSGDAGVWGDNQGATSSSQGVLGTSIATGGYGVHGKASGASSVGVYGETPAAGGFGLEGNNTSGNTGSVGVFGTSSGFGVQGNGGTRGVYGTGSTFGVYGFSSTGVGVRGDSNAAGGQGLYGFASAANGYGIYGTSSGPNSVAVYGITSAGGGIGAEFLSQSNTTTTYGVYAVVYSPSGYGIWAQNNSSTGGDGVYGDGLTGVYGNSNDSGGIGSYGIATVSDGSGIGVKGVNNASSGSAIAIQGVSNLAPSAIAIEGFSSTNIGVEGISNGATGVGVLGNAQVGSASPSYGVEGIAASASGYGVYGNNSSGAAGSGAGVYGNGYSAGVSGTSSSGYGIQGFGGNAGVYGQGGSYGVYGVAYSGVYGVALSNGNAVTAIGTNPGAYGFFANMSGGSNYGIYVQNSYAGGYGESITSGCPTCHGSYISNSSPLATDSGYALYVDGKFKSPTNHGLAPMSSVLTYVVSGCPAAESGAHVILTPNVDIGSGNRYWVTGIASGSFTIHIAAAVSGLSMYYWVGD